MFEMQNREMLRPNGRTLASYNEDRFSLSDKTPRWKQVLIRSEEGIRGLLMRS
jgi:hypothetical protein